MKKLIDKRDVLILMGLSCLGVGLFLWFGPGPALTAVGVVVTVLAVFGRAADGAVSSTG